MIENVALVFLAISFVLQIVAIALALRLALTRRAWLKLPSWWAWALTAIGLIVMFARRVVMLPVILSAWRSMATHEQLADSIIVIATSAFLAIAVLSLFRRLNRTETAIRRQRAELLAVSQVGQAIASRQELDQVLLQIYTHVRQLILLDAFCVALYDRTSDEMRMELIVEDGVVQPKFTIQVGESAGPTARVIRSRQAVQIDDLQADSLARQARPAGAPTLRAWLGLPLMAHDLVVGVISIQSHRANAFTADDERLLMIIGSQAALAIENARLHQDVAAARERYRALIDNAKDAIFIEDEDDHILDVNAQACRLMGYSREELLKMRVPDLLPPESRQTLSTIVKKELAQTEPVFESVNLHRDGTRIPVEVSVARIGERGLTLAIVRDITERKRTEDALRESEARFRSLFAAAQRQARELELLDRVRTAITRELDLSTILRAIVEQVATTFGYQQVSLYLLQSDPQTGADVLVLQHQVGYEQVISRIPITQGVSGRVVRTGQPVLLQNARSDPDFLQAIEGLVSEMCVPLFDEGKVVGMLNVETTGDMILTEADLRLMTTLSEHIGIAIARARLFASLAREKEQLELLYDVARQLSASLDARQIAQQALDRISVVTGARGGVIFMHEVESAHNASLRLMTVAGNVKTAQPLDSRMAVGEGLTGWVAAWRQSARVDDVRQDERWTTIPNVDEWVRSALSVPLLSGDELVGVLTLGSDQPGYFDQEHLRLVESVAASVAAAIANANLYQETARALARLQALGQINRVVSSSLDLGEVLHTISRHATELSNSDGAGIFELDPTDQTLAITASYNASPEFIEAVNNSHARTGQGAIGQAIATRRPAAVTDVQADPNYPFKSSMTISGYRSVLAVPMVNLDQLIGGIVIWRKQAGPFGSAEIDLLTMLADQSVVAIENAQLYHEAIRHLEEVTLIQAVALAGAANQPFDDIVAEATEQLRQLWDSHHLGFLFPDETGALRVHSSYVGLAPEVKNNLRMMPGQGLVGWVYQTRQPLAVPDVRQEPHYFGTDSATRSEMDAPLVVGDHVIGVVNVESVRLDAFSADDLRLLSALAGQLGVIFDNAQAHHDLAERAQQLQDAYHELAQAEQLKEQLVQNISHELRMPMTYIKGYTELLLDEAFGPLTDILREPLRIVNDKTQTIANLIERIVATQAMSPLALSFEPVQLADLIQETARRWEPAAQQAGIEIKVTLDDLPLVAGDRKQLGEALDGLVGNAIKFSPHGGQVRLTAHSQVDLVRVEISDSGIGIPPDKLARVFDRFYQVDGSTRRRYGGTGIGLAVVKQIVEAHGGHVWAESQGPGQGSTFYLVLPTAPAGTR